MRVGFNAWHYIPGTLGGGETYIQNLLPALADVSGVDLCVLTTPLNHDLFSSMGLDCHMTKVRAGSRAVRIAMEQLVLPRVCVRQRMDLVHTTANVAPLVSSVPVVLTVHDVHYPEYSRRLQSAYYRVFVPPSVRRSAHVITVSETSRSELLAKFNVAPEKVSVVYEAADDSFFGSRSDDEGDDVVERFGLSGDYVLYVGLGSPHKNISGLLKAFARVSATRVDTRLALVGDLGSSMTSLAEEASRLGVGNRVSFTGRVPQTDLLALYRRAKVFVLPSFFEGFGLPIVEAMASGVPVISSNRTCLPEICGGAAVLINPDDVAEMAKALGRVLSDEGLRQRLIELGEERARSFSWTAAANETVAAYRKALSLTPRNG